MLRTKEQDGALLLADRLETLLAEHLPNENVIAMLYALMRLSSRIIGPDFELFASFVADLGMQFNRMNRRKNLLNEVRKDVQVN